MGLRGEHVGGIVTAVREMTKPTLRDMGGSFFSAREEKRSWDMLKNEQRKDDIGEAKAWAGRVLADEISAGDTSMATVRQSVETLMGLIDRQAAQIRLQETSTYNAREELKHIRELIRARARGTT